MKLNGFVSNGRRVEVESHANASITLSNVSIAGLESGQSPISLNSYANLTITLIGVNTLEGGNRAAGIYVPLDTSVEIGVVATSGVGFLTATGGDGGRAGGGSGIGGNGGIYEDNGGSSGAVTIVGGRVTANGSGNGSGIGGGGGGTGLMGGVNGNGGNGGIVTITSGVVIANGSGNGSGIGGGGGGIISARGAIGGSGGNGGEVTITNGIVTASGGEATMSNGNGSGIGGGGGGGGHDGGGIGGSGGIITIQGGSVTTNGDISVLGTNFGGGGGGGAGIGGGGGGAGIGVGFVGFGASGGSSGVITIGIGAGNIIANGGHGRENAGAAGGGGGGAGIGGGSGGNSDNVVINGGNITATGAINSRGGFASTNGGGGGGGAGVGGGGGGAGGNRGVVAGSNGGSGGNGSGIIINDGEITTYGSGGGAGIGGGAGGGGGGSTTLSNGIGGAGGIGGSSAVTIGGGEVVAAGGSSGAEGGGSGTSIGGGGSGIGGGGGGGGGGGFGGRGASGIGGQGGNITIFSDSDIDITVVAGNNNTSAIGSGENGLYSTPLSGLFFYWTNSNNTDPGGLCMGTEFTNNHNYSFIRLLRRLVITTDPVVVSICSCTISQYNLAVGNIAELTAIIEPIRSFPNAIWLSSSNPFVASVDTSGHVTAHNPGITIITARYVTFTGYVEIYVSAAPITPATDIIKISSTIGYVNMFITLNGSVQPPEANQNIVWSLGNGSTAPGASVVAGQANATGVGTVVVTATVIDGVEAGVPFTQDFTIEFNEIYVAEISFNTDEKELLFNDAPFDLIAAIIPSNATNLDLRWYSSNPDIVRLDTVLDCELTRVITPLSLGYTYITVRVGDSPIYAQIRITVLPIPITDMYFDPNNVPLTIGQSVSIIPSFTPTDGIIRDVTWSSNNERVATVGNDDGIITAVSAGTAIITATTICGNFSANLYLAVVSSPVVSMPVAFPSGGTVMSGTTVTLESQPRATIRFTLDGSDPNEQSAVFTVPITITTPTTIRAVAFMEGQDYYLPSRMGIFPYDIMRTVAAPTASSVLGAVPIGTTIELFNETPGATIRFTIDGTIPTENSFIYVDTSPIVINEPTTIRARAFRDGWIDSPMVEFTYIVQLPAPEAIVSPMHFLGHFAYGSTVMIFNRIFGAEIRYTTDGSTPNINSPVFSSYVITDPVTIQAVAFKNGWATSEPMVFVIESVQAAAPFALPDSGATTPGSGIFLGTETANATIHYMVNSETNPTEHSPIFTTPIPIYIPTSIRARAHRSGLEASEISEFEYDVRVFPPTSNILSHSIIANDDAIILSTRTDGAVIRFTLDGSIPTESSPIFTESLTLNASSTIIARAFRADLEPSGISTFVYTVAPRSGMPTSSIPNGTAINLNIPQSNLVTLNHYHPDAIIRFTTNGLTPTVRSQIYTEPIEINYCQTVRARVFVPGYAPSHVVEFNYTIGVLQASMLLLDSMRHDTPFGNAVPNVAGQYYGIDFGEVPVTIFHDGDRTFYIIGHDSSRGAWGEGLTREQRRQQFTNLMRHYNIANVHQLYERTGVRTCSFRMPDMFANPRANNTISYLIGFAMAPSARPTELSGRIMISYTASDQLSSGFSIPGIPKVNVSTGEADVHVDVAGEVISAMAKAMSSLGGAVFSTVKIVVDAFPSWSNDTFVADFISYNGIITLESGRIIPQNNVNVLSVYNRNWSRSVAGYRWGAVREVDIGGYWNALNNRYNFQGGFTNYTWSRASVNLIFARVSLPTNRFGITWRQSLALTGQSRIAGLAGHDAQIAWIGSSTENLNDLDILHENIGFMSTPQIVQTQNHRVMIFLAEDARRSEVNGSILMYSLYNVNTNEWGTPRAVYDDGTADFFPSIASDGDNIWVTWHNSNTIFDDNATLDEMLRASEVVAARFDNMSETFTQFTTLTNDNILNTRPQIAVNGEDVFVAWLQNSNNDLLGINSFDTNILSRHFTNNVWGEPITITGSLGLVADMDIAHFNGGFQVAYVIDSDNNLETRNNQTLRLRNALGSLIATPAINTEIYNVQFATINGEKVLSWYQLDVAVDEDGVAWEGGNIRIMNQNGQIQSLFDQPDMPMVNYAIISNASGNTAIVYPFFIGGTGYLVTRIQSNGDWSRPIVIAETGGNAQHIDGVWGANGEFNLVFNNSWMAIIEESTESHIIDVNHLYTIRVGLPIDIMLTHVLYFAEDVQLGQPLPISLNIRNVGVPIDAISVLIDGTQIGTFSIAGGLSSGETVVLEINVPIPSNMNAATPFEITVVPTGLLDRDMSDNSYILTLGQTNLALSVNKVYQEDDSVSVYARIENQSDFAANAMLFVRRSVQDGDVIGFINLGEIGGRDYVIEVFDFDPNTLVPQGEEFEVLFFEVVSDADELFDVDNVDFTVINALYNHAGMYVVTRSASSTILTSYMSISPTGALTVGTIMTVTITPPSGQRIVANSINITGVPGITITATGATFPMPQGGGEIVVNAMFEPIPSGTYAVTRAMVSTVPADNMLITPAGAQLPGTIMTVMISAPSGQQIVANSIAISGVPGITLTADGATLPMPVGGGEIIVNAMFEPITQPSVRLNSLSISHGNLLPAFNPNVFSYTVGVANSVASIAVNATAVDGFTVTGAGTHTLSIGQNTITITVTSTAGISQIYTIIVTRASTQADDSGWWTPPTTPNLSPPINVRIDGTVISWNAVNNATGYRVYVGGRAISDIITATSFDLATLELPVGNHAIRLRAIFDGAQFNNSALSATINFVVTEGDTAILLVPSPTAGENHTTILTQLDVDEPNEGSDEQHIVEVVLALPQGASDFHLYGKSLELLIEAGQSLTLVSDIVQVVLSADFMNEMLGRGVDVLQSGDFIATESEYFSCEDCGQFTISIIRDATIDSVANEYNASEPQGVTLSFAIDITANGEEQTEFNESLTILAVIEVFVPTNANPHRIVAFHEGNIIIGVYDIETGVFTFEALSTGEFNIVYVATLKRLALGLDSPIIFDRAENAQTQVMDVLPVIQNDRTLIPIRFIAEALGAEVDWIRSTEYSPSFAQIIIHGQELLIPLDGTITPELATLGMDVPAQIIDNRTMVPLRFVSEFFGALVKWDSETRGIEIIWDSAPPATENTASTAQDSSAQSLMALPREDEEDGATAS